MTTGIKLNNYFIIKSITRIDHFLTNSTGEIEQRMLKFFDNADFQGLPLDSTCSFSLYCSQKTEFWGVLMKANFSRRVCRCILYLSNFQKGRGLK